MTINLAMTEAGRKEGERQIKAAGSIYSYSAVYTAMEAAGGDRIARVAYEDIVAADTDEQS